MKNFQGKSQQQGLALLAALLIIIIFAIMGMTAAKNARESEQFAGAEVRYKAVFEAAEQTLRRVAIYMNGIDDLPKAGNGNLATKSDKIKSVVQDFDACKLSDYRKNNPKACINACKAVDGKVPEFCGASINFRGKDTFVWSKKGLKDKIIQRCKDTKYENKPCSFMQLIDDKSIWDLAVPSVGSRYKDIAKNNYLKNIETYTFVEQLRAVSCDGNKSQHSNGRLDACSGGSAEIQKKAYYLITIKASGYPPAVPRTVENARENVIIQAVFLKK